MRRNPKELANLAHKACKGDRDAFGELVRVYEGAARAIACSHVGNEADAHDLVQDAFVTAYCKLSQLREPERFAGWLRSIVRSLCLQHRRRMARRRVAADTMGRPWADHLPASVCGEQEENAEVWRALAVLPQIHREAILLRYEGGMSYKEIADTLDLPVSTVKGRLQQGHRRLREALIPEEELVMARKKSVHKEVMQAVCRIAKEEIRLSIPLEKEKRVVLYCFVPASIEVTSTAGDELVLSGAKLAVGNTPEEAQENLGEIRVLSDHVENWSQAGPHPSQMFCGTTSESGEPRAIVGESRAFFSEAPDTGPRPLTIAQLFPEIAVPVREGLAEVRGRAAQDGATRVTLAWEHLKGVVLGREALTDEARRAFVPNYSDSTSVHGPAGRVELRVELPHGCEFIVSDHTMRSEVKAHDLSARLFLDGIGDVELADIQGDVYLQESGVKRAEGIEGDFMLSDYSFGAGDGGGEATSYRRLALFEETVLRGITGNVRADVGMRDLRLAGLSGDVRIRNRFGQTRLELSEHTDGSRYALEADSGEVVLAMRESLFGQVSVLLNSICGEIRYAPLAELDQVHPCNDTWVMTVSTVPLGNVRAELSAGRAPADLQVKTRNGNIIVEKT
ncbi:MAG: sigma-70 family RNA polymerase sigma factor [Planctomycetota bacterium]